MQVTKTESKFFNELVKDCITYRLDENEALKYIEIRFKKISLSAYKHRKANVLSDNATQIWLNNFTRVGFVTSHKQHLENIRKIQDDSLRRLFIEENKQIRNEHLILRLKDSIMETTKLLIEIELGTPIISAIKSKLEEKHAQSLQISQ